MRRRGFAVRRNEPLRQRSGYGLCARARAEFLQNRRHMMIDRFGGTVQLVCELRVADAVRQKREHLNLPGGQPRGVCAGRIVWTAWNAARAPLAKTPANDGGERGRTQPIEDGEGTALRVF